MTVIAPSGGFAAGVNIGFGVCTQERLTVTQSKDKAKNRELRTFSPVETGLFFTQFMPPNPDTK
jgi:hypothetical protein